MARRITATVVGENQGPNTAASAAPSRPFNEDNDSLIRMNSPPRFPPGAGHPTLTRDPILQTSTRNQYPTTDTSKKASSVSMYFWDTRFSGGKSQCLPHTIRDYEVCAHQFELSSEQKTKFFVNVFSGPARDFFFENTHPHMHYEELVRYYWTSMTMTPVCSLRSPNWNASPSTKPCWMETRNLLMPDSHTW